MNHHLNFSKEFFSDNRQSKMAEKSIKIVRNDILQIPSR